MIAAPVGALAAPTKELRAALRAVLLATALAASSLAVRAQTEDAADVAEVLRPGVSAYRTGNLPAAEAQFRRLVATGNHDAAAWLGTVLIDRGAAKEGVLWLQRAAEGGSVAGRHRLALALAEGTGVARDDKRAVELFEKAAEAGHRRAQLNLGTLYFRGQGVARDLVQARAWLEKAAADNDPYALYALARAMGEGEGSIASDPVRAADLFRRAAERGHPLAALRYALAMNEGHGVKRDQATAQSWLIYLSSNGYPEAALAVGDMSARTPTSRDKAMNELAVNTAVRWYEQAARAGVASAQFKLANAYFAGVGIERDPAQAQFWYGRASQQGLPEAQHAYGVWLIGGVAGQQDTVEGLKWLMLAERGGHPDSKTVRTKAIEKISPADQQRAAALVAKFVATPERPPDDGAPRLIQPPPKP
jgi:TPR repeat protein